MDKNIFAADFYTFPFVFNSSIATTTTTKKKIFCLVKRKPIIGEAVVPESTACFWHLGQQIPALSVSP